MEESLLVLRASGGAHRARGEAMTAKEQARAIAIRLNSGAFVGTGLDKDAAMIERAILEARIEEHEFAGNNPESAIKKRLAGLRSELEGP